MARMGEPEVTGQRRSDLIAAAAHLIGDQTRAIQPFVEAALDDAYRRGFAAGWHAALGRPKPMDGACDVPDEIRKAVQDAVHEARDAGSDTATEVAYELGRLASVASQQAEVDRLRQVCWDIYAACGEDTDGQKTAPPPGAIRPDVPELALQAVRDLRKDCYDADIEAHVTAAARHLVSGWKRTQEQGWISDALGEAEDRLAAAVNALDEPSKVRITPIPARTCPTCRSYTRVSRPDLLAHVGIDCTDAWHVLSPTATE